MLRFIFYRISLVCLLLSFNINYYCIAQNYSPKKKDKWVEVISDTCIYNHNNHSAFTSLINFDNSLFLAFREGEGHHTTRENKGKIRILENNSGVWETNTIIHKDNWDLRDPCLVKFNNQLYVFTSHHYSKLTEKGWTDLTEIKYINNQYPVNLWKVREYNNELYGIGHSMGKWPLLLKSKDGQNWTVIKQFKIGGNATEADLLFDKDELYVCFRVETPDGSNSLWGKSSYPFNSFEFTMMDISIASPEMIKYSKKIILLAGRETVCLDNGKKERLISLFALNKRGQVKARYVVEHDNEDIGYPSFNIQDGSNRIIMSYYTGNNKTSIRLFTFKINKCYLH